MSATSPRRRCNPRTSAEGGSVRSQVLRRRCRAFLSVHPHPREAKCCQRAAAEPSTTYGPWPEVSRYRWSTRANAASAAAPASPSTQTRYKGDRKAAHCVKKISRKRRRAHDAPAATPRSPHAIPTQADTLPLPHGWSRFDHHLRSGRVDERVQGEPPRSVGEPRALTAFPATRRRYAIRIPRVRRCCERRCRRLRRGSRRPWRRCIGCLPINAASTSPTRSSRSLRHAATQRRVATGCWRGRRPAVRGTVVGWTTLIGAVV